MKFQLTIPDWTDVAYLKGAVVTRENRMWRSLASVPSASGPPPAGGLWAPFTSYMSWQGEWIQQQYYKNDVVLDDYWTMIANKDTEDKAAPTPQGSPEYVYQGTIGSKQETQKQYVFGNRYTVADPGYINGWRINVVAGNRYAVYRILDPTGGGIVDQLVDFVATETGWQEFPISPIIMQTGAVFDFVAVASEPDPTPTTWQGDWNYTLPNNPTDPLAGGITHSNKELSILRVHQVDDNAGNRFTELNALSVGDIIDGAGIRWAIQAITYTDPVFYFSVAPAIQGIAGLETFTFETVAATPITVPYDVDYWLTFPNVQGFEGVDYSNVTLNQTAYGLDLLIQYAYISPDWDPVASGQSVTGGSGGGVAGQGVERSEWDQNGFVDRDESTLSWDDATRTLTISPTGTVFSYYISGVKYTSFGDSVQISDDEGTHLLCYDETGLIEIYPVTWGVTTDAILRKALVSIIYWSSADQEAIYVGEERHGMSMAPATHIYHHSADGLRYAVGLALTDILVDQTGNLDTHAQFGVASGSVRDEDIFYNLSTVASTVGLPIYYMTGSESAPIWHRLINSGFAVTTTGTGRVAWNQNNAGTWQLTEVTNNDFALCHVFATTEKDSPIFAIVGQGSYATKILARDGAKEEIKGLTVEGTLSPEMKAIATVIFQTGDTRSNAVKAEIVSTDEGDDYIDWRLERVIQR